MSTSSNSEASKQIDHAIASLSDWRGERLAALRKVIHEVDPAIVEEWKWMGTPVWNHDGIICLANAHKSVVKVTFPKGAKLADPQKVFNAGLGGGAWRAIDWAEGDPMNVVGLKSLLRAAIALNASKPAARKPDGRSNMSAKRLATTKKAAPVKKKKPTAKKK